MNPLIGALEMAALGCRVFPLRQGTKDGQYLKSFKAEASDDFGQIEDWDRAWPGCNWGVVGYRLIIVDLDLYHEGSRATIGMLELEGKELPPTRMHGSARGGVHMFYRVPAGAGELAQIDLGPGVQLRTQGGYVVNAGSVFQGKPYTVSEKHPRSIADAPAWLIEHCRPKVKEIEEVEFEWDAPAAVAWAVEWLSTTRAAVQGERGSMTYKAATNLRDRGISENTALELIGEHYTPRFDPPPPEHDTRDAVSHAYTYAQNPPGTLSPGAVAEAAFGDLPAVFEVPTVPEPPKENWFELHAERVQLSPADIAAIPPRPWIIPRRFIRRNLSLITAAGSTGKSLLALVYACAVALGTGEWCGIEVRERCNVLVINNEDDIEEAQRRLAATCLHYNLPYEEIQPRIHFVGAKSFKVLLRRKGTLVVDPRVNDLLAYIAKHSIGLVIADPLVQTHEAQENDNGEMDRVMSIYKHSAMASSAAFCAIHHSRKPAEASGDGHAGNMDTGRGASAIVNAARISITMMPMSEKDAELNGVKVDDRHKYVRVDDAKMNLSAKSGKPEWFERVSVPLPCGETAPTLVPVMFSRAEQETKALKLAVELLKAACREEMNLSPSKKAREKWAPKAFAADPRATVEGLTAADFEKALDLLVQSGGVEIETYGEPRKDRPQAQRYVIAEDFDLTNSEIPIAA